MESMKKDLIKKKFIFYNNDQKIEIILKGKEMTLANGPSLLNLSYHRKIGNHYHTELWDDRTLYRTYYNGT